MIDGQINQIDAALFGVTEQLPIDTNSAQVSDLFDVVGAALPISSTSAVSDPVVVQNADFS